MNPDTRKALELARDWFDENGFLFGVGDVRIAIDAALSAPAAPVAQPVSEPSDALGYATRLAVSLHASLYPDVVQWKPLPDLLGVLTQIDNMVCGIALRPAVKAQPLVESVINAARAAMDESTEAYDADMSIKIPSHLAASLSLCLDEYDRAHGIGQGGDA